MRAGDPSCLLAASNTSDAAHAAQSTSVAGLDDEESDEDASQPHLGSQNITFAPSQCGDMQRSESTSTASPITSPLTTAQMPCEVSSDISLGHDDSESEPTFVEIRRPVEPRISSKIQAKLCYKAGDSDFNDRVRKEAEKRGLTCISGKCATKDAALTFRCKEGHIVSSKEFRSPEDPGCPKCQRLLERCIEYAKAHNGRVINQTYTETIEFECAAKHIWRVKYSKYLFSKWCSHCSKLKKVENKRQKREEAQRRKEQFAEEQNAILERARQEMVAELTQAGQLLSPVGEDPISVQARQLTAKYLEELHQPMDGAVYEDTLFMYKVLLTPADELVEKLTSVGKEEQSSFYRRNAIRLHPDKNRHPQAIEAFQKFTQCSKGIRGTSV